MDKIVVLGILLPFLGTALGAGCVFFMKKGVSKRMHDALAGFAGGVMVAASIWSLLIPALDSAPEGASRFETFLPAGLGFAFGMAFLLFLDRMTARIDSGYLRSHLGGDGKQKSTKMIMLAVTLHNFPEGLAVGVALAGYLAGSVGMTAASVTALAMGIAIQNIPEGSIISLPAYSSGKTKPKAFASGVLSGIVELIGALLTLVMAHFIAPAMPFLLSFAAGAMIYVVVEELAPEFTDGEGIHIGTVMFTIGFAVMMALDVMLG